MLGWPKESTIPSRAKIRFAVTSSSITASTLVIRSSLEIGGGGRVWTCGSILYNQRFPKQTGVSMAGTDSMHESHAGVVRVEKSDVHFSCDGMDTITRAGLKAGFGMPYECNAGGCGTCRFELVEGEVVDLYPDAPVLTERDRKRGRKLACQSRPKGDVTIRQRLEDIYIPHIKPMRQKYTLVSAKDVTHDIKEFTFRSETPQRFLPGQYAQLYIPGVAAPRGYSMSSIANEPQTDWEFQIRQKPGGEATTALFERVKVGDSVQIDGPYGHGYLREDS